MTPGALVEIGGVGTAAFEGGTANAFATVELGNFRLRHLGNHVVHGHARHDFVDFIFDGVAL